MCSKDDYQDSILESRKLVDMPLVSGINFPSFFAEYSFVRNFNCKKLKVILYRTFSALKSQCHECRAMTTASLEKYK